MATRLRGWPTANAAARCDTAPYLAFESAHP